MTKIRLFASAVLLILSFFLMQEIANAQTVPSVKVSSQSVKPGGSGVMTIKFVHNSKIKIPKEPEVEISISGDNIQGTGVKNYSGGDGEYISGSTVKYNFKVGDGAVKGSTITVTGTVKYSYCNTESGICKMATKSFTTKVKVK